MGATVLQWFAPSSVINSSQYWKWGKVIPMASHLWNASGSTPFSFLFNITWNHWEDWPSFRVWYHQNANDTQLSISNLGCTDKAVSGCTIPSLPWCLPSRRTSLWGYKCLPYYHNPRPGVRRFVEPFLGYYLCSFVQVTCFFFLKKLHIILTMYASQVFF